MIKIMRSVSEDNIEQVIDLQEKGDWQFVSATQSSPSSFSGDCNRSFPATYLLVFRRYRV